MKIKPMIGQFEVPGIQRIGTSEDRRLVEMRVPGLAGSFHQDLGSSSVAIHILGTLAGDEARDGFLTKVREMFNAGRPVDFVADIATATSIEKVHIADLRVNEIAGSAHAFRYAIVLTQHVEPPPEAPDTKDVDSAVADEAARQFAVAQLPDKISSIPNFGDPTPPLKGVTSGLKTALDSLRGVQDSLKTLFG